MKFTKFLLLSIAFLCAVGTRAANISTPLPSKCEAFKPDALHGSIIFSDVAEKLARSSNFGQSSTRKSKEFWVVYSDRANNTTYVAPRSTTPYKSLAFNEKVKIAQIKDGYALVYYEPKEQGIYPNISGGVEWKGWIPMSRLLLWDSCPTNRAGIYEKAMICANLEGDMDNGKLGKLFLDPSNTDDFVQLSTSFVYYFVMKHQGSMVLLATQNTMNGISNKVLYGWVDENSFVAWNQRSCLEPTWDTEDVEYFARQGTRVHVFEDKACSTKASSMPPFVRVESNDPDRYRMKGGRLRYPILDDSKGQYWNCTTFSSPGGNTSFDLEDDNVKIFQRNLEKLSQVRLAIVIDGTRSMEKFYPAVIAAVKEVKSFFAKSYKVKVGVMIYRDKADGEYVTEMYPMTDPSNPKLSEFLANGGKYGIKSSPRDKSLEEAVYYGIDQALDRFGFDPEMSNMMFVIGDCGNSSDYPEVTKASLTKKLVDKKVMLMGFQVRNDSSSPAFTIFNNNMTGLIKESLQERFDKLTSTLGQNVQVKAVIKKNSYEFVNNAVEGIENSLYVGSHKYVQSGVLDVSELTNQLNEAVVTVYQTIKHKGDITDDAGKGIFRRHTGRGIDATVLDELWLRQRVGEERANAFINANTTISFKGYTLKKDKSSGRDYYKNVIFISQEELNSLMQRLHNLYEVSLRKGDDRRPYVEAMKALLKSMLPGITDEEMDAKGVDEIMSMVSGLNAHTRITKGPSLMDITTPKVVTPVAYQNILAKFKRQYLKLQNIKTTTYRFVYEINGSKYYWIPMEDMP